MAPCGTNHSRYASSVSPALPTTTFAPERSNHRLIDLPKRKLAVAVTASTAYVPSGLTVAAGEQWKLTLVSARTLAGGATPRSTTLRYTPPRGGLRTPQVETTVPRLRRPGAAEAAGGRRLAPSTPAAAGP